jgi:hypothetical protein
MAVLLGAIDKNKYGAYKSVYDLIDNKLKDVYQFMIINTNYVQYRTIDNKLKQVQYDYKKKKWYEFEEKGRADNPREVVIKYYK